MPPPNVATLSSVFSQKLTLEYMSYLTYIVVS